MKWSIQELTNRIRRLGSTEVQPQQQKNSKIVSSREPSAERQAERADGALLKGRGGSVAAVLPAGIEDVFCATAATASGSSSNNRPPLRRSRTLGNVRVSRGPHGNGGNVSREARPATAGCAATGHPTKTPGQPVTRPPLRRGTSDTDAAVRATAANNVGRTQQRGETVDPSTGNKPSTLPVIRGVASSTDTLRHGSNTKPDRQPPSAATRAAVDTTWPVLCAQDVEGIRSGRPKVQRRNSLPAIPYPPNASAALARSGGVQAHNNGRVTEKLPPAVRENDPNVREEINRAGERPTLPRPKSLVVRPSSFSSVHYYEALQAQHEIDREEARRKATSRREDSCGGTGTSAVRRRSKEPRNKRRTFRRSRSAQRIGNAPREEKEEKGQTRPGNRPPSTAETPGELRRTLSLGSALLPVAPRFHDGGDRDHLQQPRHETRSRSERAQQLRIEVTAEDDQDNEERINIRAISAGCGVESPSAGERVPTASSARSRHRRRSRSRPRSLEREEDREKNKQQTTTPAETATGGAAASATLAAAAAERAAAAADEAKETAQGRVVASLANAGGATAVGTAGTHHRGARGLVVDPPTTAAETHPAVGGVSSSLASSSVWVTRYLDFSSTYGLVFLLSDGSAGVLFKDNTKMVVDLAGETFDYVEPPGSGTTTPPPRPSPASSIHEAESGAGGRPQSAPPDGNTPDNRIRNHHDRYRYRLESFPFFLRKKVRILKYVRKNLYLDCGAEVERCGSTVKARTAGKNRREPLTFIEKWQRVGDTHCFQLSHQVVQVVFSDGTEVLLSKDRQVITFVTEDGKRETQARRNMEHRTEVMKRVRCAEDFMFLMLESP